MAKIREAVNANVDLNKHIPWRNFFIIGLLLAMVTFCALLFFGPKTIEPEVKIEYEYIQQDLTGTRAISNLGNSYIYTKCYWEIISERRGRPRQDDGILLVDLEGNLYKLEEDDIIPINEKLIRHE